MTTLTICRGLPASGKTDASIRAQRGVVQNHTRHSSPVFRISRDDLRFQLYGTHWGPEIDEQLITRIQHQRVRAALEGGFDVIVDDTNLRARAARELAGIAVSVGANWWVWDFDCSADECVVRDRNRSKMVGEDVIRGMASRYPNRPTIVPIMPTEQYWEPVKWLPGLEEAYIFDIDGTLAHMGDRSPYDTSEKLLDDTYSADVVAVLRDLIARGRKIVFMSGRKEAGRAPTVVWFLLQLGIRIENGDLFMRADGDNRPDDLVKYEMFNKHVRDQYNVIGVFDDRDRVVKMWRAMGLTCFQVAPGAF